MQIFKKLNLGQKFLISLVLLLLAGLAIGFIILDKYENKNFSPEPATTSIQGLPESSITPNAPTDFAEHGGIIYTVDKSLVFQWGSGNSVVGLRVDYESTCATKFGSEQCIALNVPLYEALVGKRVTVEGLFMQNEVLVRLLRIIEEKDKPILRKGDVILSWPSAVKLIETCAVRSVMQSHSLDVRLELKDGRRVRTVEPSIDIIFAFVSRAQETCGSISVATE